MKKLLLILIVFGTLLCSCKEEKRIVEKINFERKEYQFSSEITEKLSKDTIYWKYQIAAFEYATKGDYRNALILWDTAIKTRIKEFTKKKTDSINDVYAKVKAIDYIVEEAKKSQVVIINEAHHNSFHRVFTRALLKKLFDNGYKNLGLEALSNGEYLDSTLNERKYPINSTGYYTKDPQFGNLVREALEIGYTLFAYESIESEGGSGREIEQAEMIKKQIADRPNEKFLIHCGFAHAFEGVYKAWEKTMAGRLAEYTGINPLTIDQVAYSEKSNPKYNHPLLKALDIKEPVILIDENNIPLGYKTEEYWTDIAVFQPNTEYIEGRSKWLFDYGNRSVNVALDDIQIEFPVMVFAFKKGEDINTAIPVDITEVKNKEEICNLGLKKGVYEMVIANRKEAVKFEQEVK